MGPHCPTSPCCPALPLHPHLLGTPTPLCTSPPPHCFHSWPQLFTLSSHSAPSISCAITTHTLPHLLFWLTVTSHGLWTPLSLPCLFQCLHFPRGPLAPRPFRLQLSPGSPPLGPPPCLLSQQLLPFHSLHIPVPCGPFSGRNGTTAAPGRAGESKGARAQPGERRERGGRGQQCPSERRAQGGARPAASAGQRSPSSPGPSAAVQIRAAAPTVPSGG